MTTELRASVVEVLVGAGFSAGVGVIGCLLP